MGKEWDKDKGGRDKWIVWMTSIAKECLRVLKPGGHAVVWSLPRTSHWTATAWENAGFEVRDVITHVHGEGFPKSLDVSKAIDREAGEERKIIGRKNGDRYKYTFDSDFNPEQSKSRLGSGNAMTLTAPATDISQQWDGWGTNLKPACENWILLRKPLSEKTVAQNVLKWGTGALNIDACRIASESIPINKLEKWSGFGELVKPDYEQVMNNKGRFPANLVHDGSDEVVSLFPVTESGKMSGNHKRHTDESPNGIYGKFDINHPLPETFGDNGSAARFFYCAKPDREERNRGLDGMDEKFTASSEFRPNHMEKTLNGENGNPYGRWTPVKNNHPTVKSLALMEYLIKLVTPPKGTVLDCFLGSGSTLVATAKLGLNGIGIEKEEDYLKIAIGRIKQAQLQMRMDI
jgi:site-specific DNA-methyltransferase (adenine-specific)